MKRKLKTNIRVEVIPKIYFWRKEGIEDKKLNACNQILQEIKRHIDDVEEINIEYDEEEACSFCGYDWDEVEEKKCDGWPKGMPLCCKEAQLEWVFNNLEVELPKNLQYLKDELEVKKDG